MKKGKRLDVEFSYGGYSSERDCYMLLRAAILSQAITDYTRSTKTIIKGYASKTWMRYWRKMQLDCISFFKNPIYDFDDVDTRRVLQMCNEQIAEECECVS